MQPIGWCKAAIWTLVNQTNEDDVNQRSTTFNRLLDSGYGVLFVVDLVA